MQHSGADGYVAVNGLRLHYRAWGLPDTPPVLLLHGITGHAGMWDQLAASLADEWHGIAPDFRGYGRSDGSPAGDYDRSDHATDVAALVETLGLKGLTVIGHSLGGAVAMLYAASHPERVARLVIVECGAELPAGQRAPLPDHTPRPDAFADLEAALAWARRLDLYRRADAAFLHRYFTEGLMEREDGRLTWRSDARLRRRLASPDRTPATPLWYLLPVISCPTLLVRGEQSRNLGLRMAQRMLAATPNGRLVQLPGAGHGAPWDAPAALASVVRRFLHETLPQQGASHAYP